MKCQKCKRRMNVAQVGRKGKLLCFECWMDEQKRKSRIMKYLVTKKQLTCEHEWHADQDNQCNFCPKCNATQKVHLTEDEWTEYLLSGALPSA